MMRPYPFREIVMRRLLCLLFMLLALPVATAGLLDSQLATLEPPLPEEGAMILTTIVPATELRDRALTWLGSGLAGIRAHRRDS